MKKKAFIIALFTSLLTLTAMAQGHNTRMGGDEEDTESLAERIFNLEKKTDAFNFHKSLFSNDTSCANEIAAVKAHKAAAITIFFDLIILTPLLVITNADG